MRRTATPQTLISRLAMAAVLVGLAVPLAILMVFEGRWGVAGASFGAAAREATPGLYGLFLYVQALGLGWLCGAAWGVVVPARAAGPIWPTVVFALRLSAAAGFVAMGVWAGFDLARQMGRVVTAFDGVERLLCSGLFVVLFGLGAGAAAVFAGFLAPPGLARAAGRMLGRRAAGVDDERRGP
ncbi:MAG: hypothetical protein IIZ63_11795 [Caulobacteraceae bacterium]|nr:hypothetical protein [Caulobacteraceae bacterium]